MDNFTTNLIKFKSATIALFSVALFLILISLMSYWFYKGTEKKQTFLPQTKIAIPDSIEVVVDLNDYLEIVDYNTDWNFTEISEAEKSILEMNGIYYSSNGYWARKIPKRGGN